MTKCQITCKSLQKSSKCQIFQWVWHLVIFRADQLKKPPCMFFLQVNSEVKKLLVASVGEDIEARVDFLTQDKARLAADVMQYR